MKHRVHSRTR